MSDQWTERLSEYLDDDLPLADRRRLEEHLAGCADCRGVLEDLKRVLGRTQALEDRAPDVDLWPGIAGRIGTGAAPVVDLAARRERRVVRFALSLPQLAAAAVALGVLSVGTAWLVTPRKSGMQLAANPPGAAVATGIVPASAVQTTYDVAVRDLQRVLDDGHDRLDTLTVRVLQQNLRLIDSALVECRRALAMDPASPYLNAHLAATMMQKLELLRRAARLASQT